MPLSIRDIKKDLIKWGVLDDVYEAFETNIPDEQKIWNCTLNDYVVQMWINLKFEIDKATPKELLPLIPEEQKWFKKMLVKMMIGRPVYDFSPIATALVSSSNVSQEEWDYIYLHSPTRYRNRSSQVQVC